MLPSRFCQIPICPSRIGQTVQWNIQNQSQPNPCSRRRLSPCSLDFTLYFSIFNPLPQLPLLCRHTQYCLSSSSHLGYFFMPAISLACLPRHTRSFLCYREWRTCWSITSLGQSLYDEQSVLDHCGTKKCAPP